MFAVFTLVIRALPLSNNIALIVAVGSPYVALGAALVLVLALFHRRVALSVVAVAVVGVNLAIQVPWYYFGEPRPVGDHVEVRVLSSNLRKGRAEVASFVELARTTADVITVSELTPDWVRRFYATGMRADFPYSVLVPGLDAGGYGLWSRFPLEAVSPLEGGNMIATRLEIPGVNPYPVVAGVHTMNALTYYGRAFGQWRDDITAAKQRMDSLAEAAGPAAVIVAGDFNSTPDMRQFRDLLTNGYRDAVEQTGGGFAPTFPSHVRNIWFPPLVTIDHVLTRHATVSSIRTIGVRGSDHRAVLATVDVPVDPASS